MAPSRLEQVVVTKWSLVPELKLETPAEIDDPSVCAFCNVERIRECCTKPTHGDAKRFKRRPYAIKMDYTKQQRNVENHKTIRSNLIFAGAAIIALPFIVISGMDSYGFDCFDASWSDSVTMAERNAIFESAGQRTQLLLAGVALLGLGLVALPLRRATYDAKARLISCSPIAAVWIIYGLGSAIASSLYSCP